MKNSRGEFREKIIGTETALETFSEWKCRSKFNSKSLSRFIALKKQKHCSCFRWRFLKVAVSFFLCRFPSKRFIAKLSSWVYPSSLTFRLTNCCRAKKQCRTPQDRNRPFRVPTNLGTTINLADLLRLLCPWMELGETLLLDYKGLFTARRYLRIHERPTKILDLFRTLAKTWWK